MADLREKLRTIRIPEGTMLNLSGHEDDDFRITTKPLNGKVVDHKKEGLRVVVPEIDPDQIFFLHQPVKKADHLPLDNP